MSIVKFNHVSPFTFKAPANFQYHSLRELAKTDADTGKTGRTYLLRGLFINRTGQYGPQPVAVTSQEYVNLPSHLLDDVADIMNDPEIVKDINDCKTGFQIREYTNRNGGKSYSVSWVEVENPF